MDDFDWNNPFQISTKVTHGQAVQGNCGQDEIQRREDNDHSVKVPDLGKMRVLVLNYDQTKQRHLKIKDSSHKSAPIINRIQSNIICLISICFACLFLLAWVQKIKYKNDRHFRSYSP